MNNATILIVDDESQIRKLLEITLESNQYKTNFAVNAKEGLLVAANYPPDLILLDLGLPDDDGQNVLLHLRQWFQKPIIILSVKSADFAPRNCSREFAPPCAILMEYKTNQL